MVKKRKKIIKIVSIVIACFLISIPTVILPLSTVIVYEGIFSMRFETKSYMKMEVSDFDGLQVERSDFESDVTLAGYKYSREGEKTGVVIIAHGYGDGGHNKFLPYISELTKQGLCVFSYDAQGNDGSEGRAVTGFPQGIIDLDNAISHVKEIEEYEGLPIMLFAHSWGAYSAGNVLNMHPEVSACVLVSGFNESEDMLAQYPRIALGKLVDVVLLPYVTLYERLKFGKEYANISAADGMKKTDAKILIVHSKDDTRVPIEFGYDIYIEEFENDARFEFLEYENKGHKELLYSETAVSYQKEIEKSYREYLSQEGKRDTKKNRTEFMEKNLNPCLYYAPSEELLSKTIALFKNTTI
jgi:dipeptidyl aminopeptidase/acylaminoacyl peptidase